MRLTKARKTHTCTACGKPIPKGSKYYRVEDIVNHIALSKTHRKCSAHYSGSK